jgi:hypothetical protein
VRNHNWARSEVLAAAALLSKTYGNQAASAAAAVVEVQPSRATLFSIIDHVFD